MRRTARIGRRVIRGWRNMGYSVSPACQASGHFEGYVWLSPMANTTSEKRTA